MNEHQEEPWLEVEPSLDHDTVVARLEKLEARIANIEARLGADAEGDDLSADLRAAIDAIGEFRMKP